MSEDLGEVASHYTYGENDSVEAVEIATTFDRDAQHEITDKLEKIREERGFALKDRHDGPYRLALAPSEGGFRLEVNPTSGENKVVHIPLKDLQPGIDEYISIIQSHLDAIRNGQPSLIESLDMARRGQHNDGALDLQKVLAGQDVMVSRDVGRCLYTFLAHMKGKVLPPPHHGRGGFGLE